MTANVKRMGSIMVAGAILILLSGCVRSKPERELPPAAQVFTAPGAQAQALEPTVTPLPALPTATVAAPLPTITPNELLPTAGPLPTVEPMATPTLPTPTSTSPIANPTPPPPPTPALPSPAPAAGLESYVVREGDTLYSIAKRHGVSITALQEVNGLGNSDRINFGQTILLPADATPNSGPEVKTTNYWINHGDTLTSIALRYQTTPAEIMAANPAITDKDAIYVGMRIIVPVNTGAHRIHKVVYGESLISIAAKYGVTLSSLVQANGLSSANTIYAGQELVIPD